ncbi:MAG TPA: dispase autolysis-inducing protein [Thermoanaerobaculia bacterium]|nr:dispase autolysis-inducing protein [Thermoanaerobaculia bacterium]
MRRALVVLLLLAAPTAFAGRRRSVVVRPPFPGCAIVTGTPAVTYTRDAGRTLAPVAEPLRGIGYTYGLAALDTPGTLLSIHKSTLSISTDDGCSWRPVGTAEADFPPSIAAAPGGRAYIWSDNRQFAARYDSRGVRTLKAPGAIVGIGVDSLNGEHVRVGTTDGVIWDSRDGGETWDPIGQLRLTLPLLYRFAFDPHDLDHIVAGTATTGASVTRDGGLTWTQTNIGDGFNAFNIAVSPADGNVVWTMALDTMQSDTPPVFGRHIYRSTDGGLTFRSVVDHGPSVTLINGPLLAPDPRDPAVLYFVFGTYFQGYGTDLFRYDANTDQLTIAHNHYDDIDAIAFSRTDPHLIYLGLEVVQPATP